MKRFRLAGVGVAVLVVLALSAMAVASTASATAFLLAEWLENGGVISETMLVETTGELLLENTSAPVLNEAAAVKCSGILVGDVGVDGADDVTEALNLLKEAISSTPLKELALLCPNEKNCESSKVWPVGMPWLALLELWEIGAESGFVILLTSQKAGTDIGWYIECKVLAITTGEMCTTVESAAQAKNVALGVEATFSEGFTELMGLELAFCSGNEAKTGVVEGSGVEVTSLAGPLEVSE
jgi:hypothetical protein